MAREARGRGGRRSAGIPRLIWSRSAIVDVDKLYRFLASKNREAAKRAASSIRQGVKLLGRYPEAGRPVEEMPAEFREWIIEFGSGAYVVLYRYDDGDVVILAVRHGREAGY